MLYDEGWMSYENKRCIDIDECNTSPKCKWDYGICINTNGSYNCSCEEGWMLYENKSCIDIDECNTSSLCNWDHSICINTNGSFNCSCEEGWMLYQNETCIDFNECNTSFMCNWDYGVCINMNGSFNCSCEEGWMLYENNSCIDIDECYTSSMCNWDHSICINTNGSFNCSCEEGWMLYENKSCIDIDECNTSSLCNWDHSICINTNGSFNCTCEEGWMLYENKNCIEESRNVLEIWTIWSECSASCGVSKKKRLSKTALSHVTQIENCYFLNCPIDGMWGEWSESKCINSCGVDRVKTKERSCNNPLPAYDGRYCMGFIKSVEDCDIAEVCPVNGGWSGRSDWSLCSQPCRGGTISRFHDCFDPRPKYGGHQCDGNNTEFLNCPLRDCQRVAVNLRIHFLDEKYIDFYKQPMVLKFKIENAITNIYVKYNKNVSFNIDLHSIEDENLLNIYKVP